jgi:hypothetical protein
VRATSSDMESTMPRYFFNLYDASGVTEDVEGVTLPNLDAAREAAVRGARSVISHGAVAGSIDMSGRIEVLDAGGHTVLTVTFADAVEIRPIETDPV